MDYEDVVYTTLQSSINSDGLWYPSISIYYSGCDKKYKCPNCQNPELQNKYVGDKTTNNQLIRDIEKSLIKWLEIYSTMSLCFIGGEPLALWNRDSVFYISKYFKQKYNNNICTIIYSWRYIENLKNINEYLKYIDYGVLGDFQDKNKDLKFIPSSNNQYIYDFKNQMKIPSIRKED